MQNTGDSTGLSTPRRRLNCAPAVLAMVLVFGSAGGARAEGILPCGDVSGNGKVSASDALLVLRHAVGQSVELICASYGQTLRTGQTLCYEPSGHVAALIDCTGTQQDGALQRGVSRFFRDNGDGTITDDATGLMWEKLSDDDSIHDKDNGYTWSDAFASKIAMLNSASFAGRDDWRLPNRFELETLVHLDAMPAATWPPFEQGCAPGCNVLLCSCTMGTTHSLYWSSSSFAYAPTNAWVVSMSEGRVYPDLKYLGYGVRAVRDADTPE